ncbi:MAG: glycyl-radical enzyme activating protein [Bacteroidales bacterium]
MKGLIFNINRYAIHDGPGIRVTFFLKGCPLGCWWCHNPEGISPEVEQAIRIDRIGDKEFRVPETVGQEYSVDEIIEIAGRDRIFMDESGGGVTFSGGEPLMQSGFLNDSLVALSALGFHTAVDTSGFANRKILEKVAENTNLFLFDIKHMEPDKHKEYTGVQNRQIFENYEFILESGRDVIIRFPVIPGFNDDEKHLHKLRDYIINHNRANLIRFDLLPYHKIGASKYKKFNREYKMNGVEQPGIERMNSLRLFFEESGVKVKIGG